MAGMSEEICHLDSAAFIRYGQKLSLSGYNVPDPYSLGRAQWDDEVSNWPLTVVFTMLCQHPFIMSLFIFNLIIRPSLFIRFSSPLQCHFDCFSERVHGETWSRAQSNNCSLCIRINICDASFNRKMSPLTPPRSVITD